MKFDQIMLFFNAHRAAALAAILLSSFVLSGCYQKSLKQSDGDDNGDECDPDVFIEITPNPIIEDMEGCPNPVYMNLEYKVTNDSPKTMYIDRIELEGKTIVGSEIFFEWQHVDDEHTFVDPGRFYIKRFEGILVSAEIDRTPHFEFGVGKNEITATLYFHTEDEEAECTQFQASDRVEIIARLKTGECPVDD